MKSKNFIVVFSSGVFLAGNSHSGHWGINSPPSKTPPTLSCQSPLSKLSNTPNIFVFQEPEFPTGVENMGGGALQNLMGLVA